MSAYRLKKARDLGWDDVGSMVEPIDSEESLRSLTIEHHDRDVIIRGDSEILTLSPEAYVRLY